MRILWFLSNKFNTNGSKCDSLIKNVEEMNRKNTEKRFATIK
jgi:hypothetical protein